MICVLNEAWWNPETQKIWHSRRCMRAKLFKWLFKWNGLCIARVCKKIDKISSIVCMLLLLQPWSFLKHLIYLDDKITNRYGWSLYGHKCWNITDLPASEEERLREPAIEKWAIKLLNAVVVFLLFFHFICSPGSSSGTPNWIQTNKSGRLCWTTSCGASAEHCNTHFMPISVQC